MILELKQRKNHRLKNYDYGSYGYYYVTICTLNRENVLCNIVGSDALVAPSETGMKVIECWNNIALLNENIEVDKFTLMPNHIHGIIIIKNMEPIEVREKKYDFEITERRGRRSLKGLIKDFKSGIFYNLYTAIPAETSTTLFGGYHILFSYKAVAFALYLL